MNVLGDQADRDYLLQNAADLKVVDLQQKLLIAVSREVIKDKGTPSRLPTLVFGFK